MKRVLSVLMAAILVVVLGCTAAFAHHGDRQHADAGCGSRGACIYCDSYGSRHLFCDENGDGLCDHTGAVCGDADGDGLCDLCGTAHRGWTGGHHGGGHHGGHHGCR